jgi:streptogramin lyase
MPSHKHPRFAEMLAKCKARLGDESPASDAAHDADAIPGVTITLYPTTQPTTGPVFGPNGNVWFSIGGISGGTLGEFIAAAKTVRQCPDTEYLVQEICADKAGNLWFGIAPAPVLGCSTTSCNIVTFPTAGQTIDLVLGPDGNVYFSDSGKRIGQAAPNRKITQFPTSFGSIAPIVGRDGAIWFGEWGPKLGRLSIPGYKVTEWTVTASDAGTNSLLASADGSIWYGTDVLVGRITPQGQVVEYKIGGGGAFNLLEGPDGNVWFAGQYSPQVGKVTPQGEVWFYDLNALPMGMAFGADNRLYVGEIESFLAIIDPQGKVAQRPIPGVIPWPPHLGPDNNVWFGINGAGSSSFIGRATPAGGLDVARSFGYPNTYLNGRDGRSMYMGWSGLNLGVATFG